MSTKESPAPPAARDEISALIASLHAAGQRLEELTAGEVDTVADHEGQTFVLRRAQEQLRRIEADRQAAILNALPAHIALLDTQGLIVSVNEAWHQFRGVGAIQGPGHRIGVNYLESCALAQGDGSSEAHQVAEGIRSILRGGIDSFATEYRCDSPAEQRYFQLTVVPLAGERPDGAVVMQVDITERKEGEESLRVSESRFRQMAESISDMFFLQSLDASQIYYVSPAYEQIWGRSCESLYANPRSWMEAIHPDDLDAALKNSSSAGRNMTFDYDFRIIRPDGDTRWINVRGFPILDAAGNPYRTAGVASDITQRKYAEEALRESERRFSDMLGNVALASVMLDRDANITYCNEYLLRLTGWGREEVIGRSWFERFIPPEATEVREVFASILANRPETRHHDNPILTRAGGLRLMRWNNSVLRSGAGDVVGTASIGEDITERKAADDVLEKRAVELERFHRLSVGRELQMIELKKQVNELTRQSGQDPPYDLAFLRPAGAKAKPGHEQAP